MVSAVGYSLGLAWDVDQAGLELQSRYQANGTSLRESPLLSHEQKGEFKT
jgi:hypothetical protein